MDVIPAAVLQAIKNIGVNPVAVFVIEQPPAGTPTSDTDPFPGRAWTLPGTTNMTFDLSDFTVLKGEPAPLAMKTEPAEGESICLLLPGNTAAYHSNSGGYWLWL